MERTSAKTVRIREIARDTSLEDFIPIIIQLAKPEKGMFRRKKQPAEQSPRTSFARQGDNIIATATFETADLKTNALENALKNARTFSPDKLILDDIFNGVTILHSPEDADIEYVLAIALPQT
jgi:hypothetical protein